MASARLSGWEMPYSTCGMDAWCGSERRMEETAAQSGMAVDGSCVECAMPIAFNRAVLVLLLLVVVVVVELVLMLVELLLVLVMVLLMPILILDMVELEST